MLILLAQGRRGRSQLTRHDPYCLKMILRLEEKIGSGPRGSFDGHVESAHFVVVGYTFDWLLPLPRLHSDVGNPTLG